MSFPAAYAWANVAAGSTDATLTLGDGSAGALAATTGYQVCVLQVFAMAAGTATNVTLNSKGAGAGTAIGPAAPAGANGGCVLPFSPMGWMRTNGGETLTVTTGAGSTVAILVGYKLVPV